ncbi:MAG: 50S ribosomal protein L29 [Lamprobacter sp.]|uniref:50S ribosomal protein L29 n=1 Tax=Lamprobacter sp. TaxID=3100796 RepID=UPI002B2601D3|nr:50S ribosomal protein L29 [Lamprobacter sp.]MEA3641602.1 50S ribosomal protein L29 [Lamprobacter sp.]
MKAHELRTLGTAELEKRLHELLKEQFNLRMQQRTGQLSRPSQVKAVRRDISRVKTLMTEKHKAAGIGQ